MRRIHLLPSEAEATPPMFFFEKGGARTDRDRGVHSGACLIQYHKRYQCSGEQFRYETVIGVLCYMHVAET